MTTTGSRDLATRVGIAAVAAATAVGSWTNLVELGEATSYALLGGRGDAAWLLPVALDGYAYVAARTWLDPDQSASTRHWGAVSSLAALVLSIAGNFGGHAVTSGAWTPGWLSSSAVATAAPLMLFAAAMLWKLRTRDRLANGRSERPAKTPPRTRTSAPVASDSVTPIRRKANSPTAAAVATHTAYEAAVADGHTDGPRTVATYQLLARVLDVSERTVRRHMATYAPRREVAASGS